MRPRILQLMTNAHLQVITRGHSTVILMYSFRVPSTIRFHIVSGASRTKIDEVTLNALRTRQSLVKGERLMRTEVRAVLPVRNAEPRSRG